MYNFFFGEGDVLILLRVLSILKKKKMYYSVQRWDLYCGLSRCPLYFHKYGRDM